MYVDSCMPHLTSDSGGFGVRIITENEIFHVYCIVNCTVHYIVLYIVLYCKLYYSLYCIVYCTVLYICIVSTSLQIIVISSSSQRYYTRAHVILIIASQNR